jgi:hypothetical protein
VRESPFIKQDPSSIIVNNGGKVPLISVSTSNAEVRLVSSSNHPSPPSLGAPPLRPGKAHARAMCGKSKNALEFSKKFKMTKFDVERSYIRE